MKNNFSAIVLAAGIGKRMQSQKSKILHPIGGEPMIKKTVRTLKLLKPDQIIVVTNPSNNNEVAKILKDVDIVIQKEAKGTADAAFCGLEKIKINTRSVAVLYGDDTAFYTPNTIQKVFDLHTKSKSKITFVTVKKENPYGLGRIVRENSRLISIVEEKDANQEQKMIKEVNNGLYFFQKDFLNHYSQELKPSKVTGELYITDLIEIALKNKLKVETFLLEDNGQWHGINTQIELAKANFKLDKSIHIMGISGSGAAAVAGIALQNGFDVTGCDTSESDYSKDLEVKILKSHSPVHLNKVSCLVISPAVEILNPENIEIKKAKEIGIPVITWQEFQGAVLIDKKFTISVAGTFGKSTTTAMIGSILDSAKLDPTVEVGAKVLSWNKNFLTGTSDYYVVEADEYNDNFLHYKTDIAVILNIDWDHPDYFKSEKEVLNSYIKFANLIKENGILITTATVWQKIKNSIRNDIKYIRVKKYSNYNLSILGKFRSENANAALTVAQALNLNMKNAESAISNFSGLARRLELKGIINKTKIYDDYAVQPYTIMKTANAIREYNKKSKILLILEPHTFSRVNKFFNKFVKSLKNTKVDQMYITDVFAAREQGNISLLAKKLTSSIGQKAKYSGSLENTTKLLKKNLNNFDIVCTMGAGNVYKIYNLIK